MKLPRRSIVVPGLVALLMAAATMAAPLGSSLPAHADSAAAAHHNLDCSKSWHFCTEVYDSEKVFGQGHYVGHDEPSVLFYSSQAGSGNQMVYYLRLPNDPASPPPTGTRNFQLHPAFWFGMAMCDTQSFPEQRSDCTPNSDGNIVDPAVSPNHPGSAFMEMQFYPPAGPLWPSGGSCDPVKWCAALNIDSLAQDPVHNTQLGATCLAQIGGNPEYVNFAFITLNGQAQAPANPVQSTTATFTPDPTKDLFMNSGDSLLVILTNTANGLAVVIEDQTTHQNGYMVASAANSFGQVQYTTNPFAPCINIPYNFHPMYSTSSEQTRVPWTSHSYNIAFADETGHLDYCNAVFLGFCFGAEGPAGDLELADADDTGCFAAPANGCTAANTGFDGVPYQKVWPDGNYQLHPVPIIFSSPLTGPSFNVRYSRVAFEADLPAIESQSNPLVCDSSTGAGCTLVPQTDDGTPANFYPFFTGAQIGSQCVWTLGNDVTGLTTNDFGKNAQYGSLLPLSYTTTGGGAQTMFNDFRQVFTANPCTVSNVHGVANDVNSILGGSH